MITPKEKAKELVNKYRKYVDDGRHNGFYSGEITFENQKQCALIAVDAIISYCCADDVLFLHKVKEEIEKL